MGRLEVIVKHMPGNTMTEKKALLQGVAVMEAGIDTGAKHLPL